MQSIKVKDLKVGMETDSGYVEDIAVLVDGKIDVTFSIYDYDCGENEYFPCIFNGNDAIGLM